MYKNTNQNPNFTRMDTNYMKYCENVDDEMKEIESLFRKESIEYDGLDNDELEDAFISMVDTYSDNDNTYSVQHKFSHPKYNKIEYEDYSLCVLCGKSEDYHIKYSTHRFIQCKQRHRCIHCDQFFYQHSHVNSCYQPFVSVQIGER